MTEQYAGHDEEEALLEHSEASSSGASSTEALLAPLIERVEALERRLDELTGEADTVVGEEYDSGEA